ncbi:MAG: sulfite exporter TauE/SafE family protein [Armatimonadota bacterium]
METVGIVAMALVGLVLGLLGGGGAVLTVPLFLGVFHRSLSESTVYSLFVVGVVSTLGAALAARRGQVDAAAAARFALPAFATVWATRRFLVPTLPALFGGVPRDAALLVVFALLMVVAGLRMLPRASAGEPDVPASNAPPPRMPLAGIPQSVAVGFLTGLFGAGGGFLIVPALVLVHRLPMARAVGTSLLVIAANAWIGFLGDTAVRPSADYRLLAACGAVAALGMVAGSLFSARVPAVRLRAAFALFLFAMAAWTVVRGFLEISARTESFAKSADSAIAATSNQERRP